MTLEKYNWLFEIYQKINFDKLPHGIIINGSNGIGKKLLANEIAAKLLINKSTNSLDRELIESNSHPDLFIVDKDKIILRHITYRKSQKKEDWDEELGERNVNNFLSMSSSISRNKVVILFNAETMNPQSQAAILKTLEEPSPNSYIIFTTNRPKSLFETIYSRCQMINIPNLTETSLNDWLSKNGISDLNSNHFPSFISPLNILEDIQNDQYSSFKNFVFIISDYIENKLDTNLAIKNISNLEIDFVTKTNYLIEFLKILLKSNLLSEELSGLYKKFNSSKFNNLKISNLIKELNDVRYNYFSVPQINETHVLNYFFSELKNSIKI